MLKGNNVAVSGNGKIAVYDRQQRKIIDEKPNPAGDFTHMASGPDGPVYGVNPKRVARISTDATIEILTDEGGKFAAVDGQGRVYFAQGPKLLRCSPP